MLAQHSIQFTLNGDVRKHNHSHLATFLRYLYVPTLLDIVITTKLVKRKLTFFLFCFVLFLLDDVKFDTLCHQTMSQYCTHGGGWS